MPDLILVHHLSVFSYQISSGISKPQISTIWEWIEQKSNITQPNFTAVVANDLATCILKQTNDAGRRIMVLNFYIFSVNFLPYLMRMIKLSNPGDK